MKTVDKAGLQTIVTFQIKKDLIDEVDEAIEYEHLASRSSLIRHLLWCWLGEVRNGQQKK